MQRGMTKGRRIDFLIGPLYGRIIELGKRCDRRSLNMLGCLAAAAITAG